MSIYKIFVEGRVQGVFYRKFVSEALDSAGYKGYVRNLSDGRVEVVVDIENRDDLNEVSNILYKGSPGSIVEDIKIETSDNAIDIGNNGFKIKYS